VKRLPWKNWIRSLTEARGKHRGKKNEYTPVKKRECKAGKASIPAVPVLSQSNQESLEGWMRDLPATRIIFIICFK